MIPVKINNTHLCQIFEPTLDVSKMTEEEIVRYSIAHRMFPSEVALTSETYARDAERTADYELEELTLVNRKSKPEFTWELLRTDYVKNLMSFLKYAYDFKNLEGIVVPRASEDILVTYLDFVGARSIVAYLGQTIEGTLVEYDGISYWQDFRIAFPER